MIYLRVYYEGKRLTYYLPLSIDPNHWIKEEQRPLLYKKEFKTPPQDGTIRQYQDIKDQLDRYGTETTRIYGNFRYNGQIPSPKQMKEELDKVFRKQPDEAKILLFGAFIDDFIARSNKKSNTMRNYHTTKRHFEAFEKKTGKKYRLTEMDLNFYDAFVRYFMEKPSSTNTIGTNIKNIKVFLADADDRGYVVNQDFRKKHFKTVEEDADTIYLNEAEIDAIANLKLKQDGKLDRVRDWFVVGCLTGLRYSDYHQLRKENIESVDNRYMLTLRMIKTGLPISVPVNPQVLNILNKYVWDMPKVLSNQKTNEYLKEIAAAAKLNSKELIHRTNGNLRHEETLFKWQLVSTHTARRSFATNAYYAGIPTIKIMLITGHKTERSFLKYIRIKTKENALDLIDHPFFTRELKQSV